MPYIRVWHFIHIFTMNKLKQYKTQILIVLCLFLFFKGCIKDLEIRKINKEIKHLNDSISYVVKQQMNSLDSIKFLHKDIILYKELINQIKSESLKNRETMNNMAKKNITVINKEKNEK